METKQAIATIEDVFQHPFNREKYIYFITNLLNQIESRDRHYSGNLIPEAYRGHINQYWRIGKYISPDEEEVDILIVEVKSLSKLDRARTTLRNFAINRLKQFEKDYSLIAFYSQEDGGADWRFSFIKIEHQAYLDEQGKVKTKTDLTPARRYSYLVGEHENTYTAGKQLFPLLESDAANPTVEEIEQAFSIEKVTGEFFQQYKELYIKLAEQLKKQPLFAEDQPEQRDLHVARFAKKLLGQIVFLYFLQKKGWLGVDKDQAWGAGDKRFLRNRYDAMAGQNNYYSDFLQYLFYQALAQKRDDDWYQRFNCKIPFLNGGLFEADYDWQKDLLIIPNEIFHNTEKNKAGDFGTGILDVFDRYNFTIKEDEPLEKEVAVDPEMLGKVFENMLEITERKSKGAFYTPREIVHYMCQQSLIQYLQDAVPDIPNDDLDKFIHQGHLFLENAALALVADKKISSGEQKTTIHKLGLPDSIRDNAEQLDAKLEQIKICDPAIGSGAFPVGLLHEIVNARLILQTVTGQPVNIYELKRHCIQQSIYGVDIDASGIDIARLRLWLALIVDEPDDGSIAALPNLDYKIMQGNSLVEDYQGVKLFNEDFINQQDNFEAEIQRLKKQCNQLQAEYFELHKTNRLTADRKRQLEKQNQSLVKQIKKLQHANINDEAQRDLAEFDLINAATTKAKHLEQLHQDFFSASTPDKKADIRQQITTLEWELIEATLQERNQTEALAKIQQLKQNNEKPFFLWKLNFPEVFKQHGGFDVVIGYPPYLRIQGIRDKNPELAGYLKNNYQSATGSYDLYTIFTEKGLSILNEKGILNFIMPVKWTNAAFGKGLRKVMEQLNAAKKIISFSAYQVFNASTYTGIQWFQKGSKKLDYLELDRDLPNNKALGDFINAIKEENFNSIATTELSDDAWVLSDAITTNILKKIDAHKNKANNIFLKIFQGIATSKDSVYFLQNCIQEENHIVGESKELGKNVKIENGLVKPLLKGDQVHRYQSLHTDKLVIFPYKIVSGKAELFSENEIKELFPFGYQYLKENETVLRNREKGRLLKDEYWYRYIYPKNLTLFDRPKLIAPDVSLGGNYTFDDTGKFYTTTTLYGYIVKEPENYTYHYLMAILNSTVCWYYLVNTGTVLANGYFRFKPDYINNFSIPNASSNKQTVLSNIVIYLLILKEKSSQSEKLMTTFFEQLIDGLVFELYFAEEINAANKPLLEHLGELKPLADAMTEEEKRTVIQSEFDRLYDPNHPVRNHLETLDSVEEVRIIKEALA